MNPMQTLASLTTFTAGRFMATAPQTPPAPTAPTAPTTPPLPALTLGRDTAAFQAPTGALEDVDLHDIVVPCPPPSAPCSDPAAAVVPTPPPPPPSPLAPCSVDTPVVPVTPPPPTPPTDVFKPAIQPGSDTVSPDKPCVLDPKPVAPWARTWTSTGDPHEVSGNGTRFDNSLRGDFTKLRSASGDFVVQTRQGAVAPDNPATVNVQLGVKVGADVVQYDAFAHQLSINGKVTTLKAADGPLALPGGGSLRQDDHGTYLLTSPKGDVVTFFDGGGYDVEIGGTISPSRKPGEVAGSIGTFDETGKIGGDLIGRDGKAYDTSADGVRAFEETWRTTKDENVLPPITDKTPAWLVPGKAA